MSSAPSLYMLPMPHWWSSKTQLTADFLKGLTQPPETQRLELLVQPEAVLQGEASFPVLSIPPRMGCYLFSSAKALTEEGVKLRKLVPLPDTDNQ